MLRYLLMSWAPRLRLLLPGLVASLFAACSEYGVEADPAWVTVTYAGERSLGEVLEEIGSVVLEQDSSHVIGGLGDMAVDSLGRMYLADTRMRELKAWDADGSFRGVVGAVGEGPGEYLFPSSVDLHPESGRIAVLDALGRRLVTYDPGTLETTETRQIAAPVSTIKLLLGRGDTTFVAGVASNYASELPHVAAIVADSNSMITSLLPLPERLRNRAFGGSYLSGFFDRINGILFLGIRGSGVLYRLNLESSSLDSVALPPAFYEEPDFPAVGAMEEASQRDMGSFMSSRIWTNALVALDEHRVLVGKMVYSHDDELWRHQWALLTWDESPALVSFPPCHCFAVAEGDRLGMLEGFYPRPYTLTWYSKPTNAEGT